jgi:Fe-S oxidoreductase
VKDALSRAAELCEFCPKMCRFACPVSDATAREAFTPWGKVSIAALATRSPDTAAARAFAACTGCFRCQIYCAHANDVPAVLHGARAAAVRAGTAPAVWSEIATRTAARGHAEEADLLAAHRRVAAAAPVEMDGPQLFAGCDALARGGGAAVLALRVAAALGAPLRLAPEQALCCGFKIAQAGHPELFEAHAARTRAAFGRAPVHLVFLAPECARAVREKWPALPAASRVEHVTTYLARALAARSDLRDRPPLPRSVAYHDPCELARGLSECAAPRALLAAAVEDVREPVRTGPDASCCGAGGLLPRTLPDVAAAVAADRRRELDACGAPAVTASVACAAALEAGDLLAVVADWLGLERAPEAT